MAAFKRPGSKFYQIGPLRAGAIDVPRMTTGQTAKQVARAMEQALKIRAVTGYADLVQRVADKALSLVDFYAAHVQGDRALQELRERANDPPLSEIVPAFRAELADERHQTGLDLLLALAPKGARLSWVRNPKNLSALYRAAVRGDDLPEDERKRRSPNSVRRSLHQGIAALLKAQLGRGAMLAVMAEVDVPGEQDERQSWLTLDEIQAALDLADDEFRPVLGAFLTTGMDRKPMLMGRCGDYDEAHGALRVRDTKAKGRMRTLLLRGEPVLENAEYWLRLLVAGREADEPLCRLTKRQIQLRWESIRREIGRTDVRLKDLRGTFATYYLLAGGDMRSLQEVLGHTTLTMSARYLRRLPAGNRDRLRAAARTAGRWKGRMKVERREAK